MRLDVTSHDGWFIPDSGFRVADWVRIRCRSVTIAGLFGAGLVGWFEGFGHGGVDVGVDEAFEFGLGGAFYVLVAAGALELPEVGERFVERAARGGFVAGEGSHGVPRDASRLEPNISGGCTPKLRKAS
ncbi:MAG TPA: hypothetical protein VN428_23245, partial [Bryobacteraceae bacterium]|nr:hypothetical protein [Bryobacteraceae bacterium]